MAARKWRLPALTLVLGSLACTMFGFPLLTPTASAPVPPTATPLNVPALTAQQVLNAEYTSTPFEPETYVYQFTDGAYQQGADPSAADFVSIHIVGVPSDQRVVFGDLNRDGVDDAAVVIAENYGGTGIFVSVAALLNENGQPRHAASFA